MALTNIADQKTPGRPIELTFGADTGLPSTLQQVLLIGHAIAKTDPASGTATAYKVITLENSADEAAGLAEAESLFGTASELSKMVLAAIKANAGNSTFPTLKCIPLAASDADYGSADVALTNAQKVAADFIATCYDGNGATLRDKLKAHCVLVSGAQRVDNAQFGTTGVVANIAAATAGALLSPDSQNLLGVWLRDQGALGANPYSLGELAAASAAVIAGNNVPFNPLDDITLGSVPAPANDADWITVGAGLESEAALAKGWTPLHVKPNGEVAFVRTVTSRITVNADGVTPVGSYYDVQDFQVLYYWRKTLWTRFGQPDFRQRKASLETAKDVLAEMIRMANLFQDNNMFQAVAQLAKQFQVQRSASDRHRFDYKTPVNVIPGLHVLAGNIQAGTQFDTLSI